MTAHSVVRTGSAQKAKEKRLVDKTMNSHLIAFRNRKGLRGDLSTILILFSSFRKFLREDKGVYKQRLQRQRHETFL